MCDKKSERVIWNDENKDELLVLFFSRKSCFSNFYLCKFVIQGVTFTSTEQYFHYMKAFIFKNFQAMHDILNTQDPLKQKQIGRRVKNFDEFTWLSYSFDVMQMGLLAKFAQNEDLKQKLLSFPNARFAEASPYDLVWGIGLAADHPDASKPSKWPGNNLMGKALTEVRDIIKETISLFHSNRTLRQSPRKSRLTSPRQSRSSSPRQSRSSSPRQSLFHSCRSSLPRQSRLPSAICDEFLKNPKINPLTNRRISPKGLVYKNLVRQCRSSSPQQSRSPSRLPSPRQSRLPSPICDKFIKNPNINPRTNRRISPQGLVYKNLVIECRKSKRDIFSNNVRRSPSRSSSYRRSLSTICDKFIRNPNINPRTNRRISPQGLVYKKLLSECRKSKRDTLPPIRVMKPSNNVRRSPNPSLIPQRNIFKKYEKTPSEKSVDLLRVMIFEVNGDITEIKCDYVCQQTNCVGTYPGGLAKTIAEKLGVNPYKLRTPSPGRRNFAITADHNRMGDVTITQSPVKDVKVVCMFAQYYPGKINPQIESMAEREEAFEVCLRKMDREIPRNAMVAFPKYIGCGIAGGIWENYLRKIHKFSINRNVYIVNIEGQFPSNSLYS